MVRGSSITCICEKTGSGWFGASSTSVPRDSPLYQPKDVAVEVIGLPTIWEKRQRKEPYVRYQYDKDFKITWTSPILNTSDNPVINYNVRYRHKRDGDKNVTVPISSIEGNKFFTTISIHEFLYWTVYVNDDGIESYYFAYMGDYVFHVKAVYRDGISSSEVSRTVTIGKKEVYTTYDVDTGMEIAKGGSMD